MSKEFIIYADESERWEELFSNFFGGVLVVSTNLAEVVNKLQEANDINRRAGCEESFRIADPRSGCPTSACENKFQSSNARKFPNVKIFVWYNEGFTGGYRHTVPSGR